MEYHGGDECEIGGMTVDVCAFDDEPDGVSEVLVGGGSSWGCCSGSDISGGEGTSRFRIMRPFAIVAQAGFHQPPGDIFGLVPRVVGDSGATCYPVSTVAVNGMMASGEGFGIDDGRQV